MLLVGDLRQLPPVAEKTLYDYDNPQLYSIGVQNLWKMFRFYELQTIMRQTDDQIFIQVLNRFGEGTFDFRDLDLLNSRNFEDKITKIPSDAVHLFHDNNAVDEYNELALSRKSGEEEIVFAEDKMIGATVAQNNGYLIKDFQNLSRKDTRNYQYRLNLKISGRYMLISNIDTCDGLTNGSVGTLEYIFLKRKIYVIFMRFENSEVGEKARLNFGSYKKLNIPDDLTSLYKRTVILSVKTPCEAKIARAQFPINAAEALTIHKSQGSTFINVCIHLDTIKKVSTSLIYVALSRTKSLKKLFLIGNLKEEFCKIKT